MQSPVFIFSMPRSGSTLLQRLLMGHSQIASTSEPWILLPLLYANRSEGVLAEYSHLNSQKAINDLIQQLPRQEDSYYQGIAKASNHIYSSLCPNGERYFLDKTPRYYLIIPHIKKLYPNAKFIFLFRHPADIYASIMTTWGDNTFRRLYASHIDLTEGLKYLSDGWHLLHSQAIRLNYEELVKQPEESLKRIYDYLELPFEPECLVRLQNQEMNGRLGDPTGIKQYQGVEKQSLNRWKKVFNTRVRQWVLKEYINTIDSSVLLAQGYSKHQILQEVDELSVSYSGSVRDLLHIIFYKSAKFLNAHLFFTRLFRWAREKYLS